MSQAMSVQKWKIVAGAIVAVVLGLAGGGATERFVLRRSDGPSVSEIKEAVKEAVDTQLTHIRLELSREMSEYRASIEKRMSDQNESIAAARFDAAASKAKVIELAATLNPKMDKIIEDMAFIRGKWERQ